MYEASLKKSLDGVLVQSIIIQTLTTQHLLGRKEAHCSLLNRSSILFHPEVIVKINKVSSGVLE